jgi:predicted DNA-binding transcriptional regulator YafY
MAQSRGNASSLPVLLDALWRDRQVRFVYEALLLEAGERTVDPLGLLARGSTWYLITTRNTELRTYRVSRMRDAQTLDPSIRPRLRLGRRAAGTSRVAPSPARSRASGDAGRIQLSVSMSFNSSLDRFAGAPKSLACLHIRVLLRNNFPFSGSEKRQISEFKYRNYAF